MVLIVDKFPEKNQNVEKGPQHREKMLRPFVVRINSESKAYVAFGDNG